MSDVEINQHVHGAIVGQVELRLAESLGIHVAHLAHTPSRDRIDGSQGCELGGPDGAASGIEQGWGRCKSGHAESVRVPMRAECSTSVGTTSPLAASSSRRASFIQAMSSVDGHTLSSSTAIMRRTRWGSRDVPCRVTAWRQSVSQSVCRGRVAESSPRFLSDTDGTCPER